MTASWSAGISSPCSAWSCSMSSRSGGSTGRGRSGSGMTPPPGTAQHRSQSVARRHRERRTPLAPATTRDRPVADARRLSLAAHDRPMTRTTLIDLETPIEKVFLVAVDTGAEDGWSAQDSLSELAQPRDDRGCRRRRRGVAEPPPRRPELVCRQGQGRGPARGQARDRLRACSSPTTSCRRPSSARSRSCCNVKVIDRSRLILDIFALHAQTHEGRLQVELAQLEYQLPRLTQAVDPPVADPGRHRLARTRREPARDRPPDHPDPDLEDEGAGRAGPPAARDRGPWP